MARCNFKTALLVAITAVAASASAVTADPSSDNSAVADVDTSLPPESEVRLEGAANGIHCWFEWGHWFPKLMCNKEKREAEHLYEEIVIPTTLATILQPPNIDGRAALATPTPWNAPEDDAKTLLHHANDATTVAQRDVPFPTKMGHTMGGTPIKHSPQETYDCHQTCKVRNKHIKKCKKCRTKLGWYPESPMDLDYGAARTWPPKA